MIPTGRRVTVVASSNSKPGTNIRRGSTGFIVGNGKMFNEIKKLNIGFLITDIIFTRFGFEKKERLERKPVVILMPMYQPDGIVHYQKHLNGLVSRVQDSMEIFRRETNGYFGNVANFDIVVVANAPTDILKELNDMKAWYLSIVSSNLFSEMLHSWKKDESSAYFNKCLSGISTETRNLVRKTFKSKNHALYMATELFNNPVDVDNEAIYKLLHATITLKLMKSYNRIERTIPTLMGRQPIFLKKSAWRYAYGGAPFNAKFEQIVGSWVKIFDHLSSKIY